MLFIAESEFFPFSLFAFVGAEMWVEFKIEQLKFDNTS